MSYTSFPNKIYVVRNKTNQKYRSGTYSSAIPKLYKHSPGLKQGEELVEVNITIVEERETKATSDSHIANLCDVALTNSMVEMTDNQGNTYWVYNQTAFDNYLAMNGYKIVPHDLTDDKSKVLLG